MASNKSIFTTSPGQWRAALLYMEGFTVLWLHGDGYRVAGVTRMTRMGDHFKHWIKNSRLQMRTNVSYQHSVLHTFSQICTDAVYLYSMFTWYRYVIWRYTSLVVLYHGHEFERSQSLELGRGPMRSPRPWHQFAERRVWCTMPPWQWFWRALCYP